MIAHVSNTDVRLLIKKVKSLPFCFMVQINLQQKSIQQVQVSPFKKPDRQAVEDPFLPAPKLFYKGLVASKRKPHCHMPNPPSNNTLRY